jgi:hypothetical protein
MRNEKTWLNEPDYKRWRDGETQLQCLILRAGSTGALCGYVRLPKNLAKKMIRHRRRFAFFSSSGRAYRRAGYDMPAFRALDVHGGLTYSGSITTRLRGKERGVWVGFDCAHFNDLTPTLDKVMERNGIGALMTQQVRIYRDINYVTNEVKALARQIKEIAQ